MADLPKHESLIASIERTETPNPNTAERYVELRDYYHDNKKRIERWSPDHCPIPDLEHGEIRDEFSFRAFVFDRVSRKEYFVGYYRLGEGADMHRHAAFMIYYVQEKEKIKHANVTWQFDTLTKVPSLR